MRHSTTVSRRSTRTWTSRRHRRTRRRSDHYFGRLRFYSETENLARLPWVAKIAFTAPDARRCLFEAESQGRRSKHIFFEKVLDDGRVLGTQISHSDDEIASSGVFGEILRSQLEVSQAELWEWIRTGTPVERPISVDPAPVEHAMYVIRVLTGELHMTSEEIAELSAEEAIEIVNKHWAGG